MPKEYKSTEELMAILESRGVALGPDTRTRIMREGYYQIVNGYKSPFLDRQAMQSHSEDVYMPGVEFDWIYSLFSFDRDLRALTFQYLTRAESAMKSAVVEAFCREHRDPSDYLEIGSYTTARDMLVPKGYRGNRTKDYQRGITKLLGTLGDRASDSSKEYIAHYAAEYGFVPLWVLSKDLTFGNIAHFYRMQKRGVQNAACKILAETRGDGPKLTPQGLHRAFSVLVGFRNICAHGDRLYCAKVGKQRDIDFGVMLSMLRAVLPESECIELAFRVSELADSYDGRLHCVTIDSLFDEKMSPKNCG